MTHNWVTCSGFSSTLTQIIVEISSPVSSSSNVEKNSHIDCDGKKGNKEKKTKSA